jgi:hypothetical protein
MRTRYRWNPETLKLEQIPPTRREYGLLVCPDIPAYVSPVTGKLVDGRKARREDLKRHGCRPYEGREQETKEARRRVAYAEAAQERSIGRTVETLLREMPDRVRRPLLGHGE